MNVLNARAMDTSYKYVINAMDKDQFIVMIAMVMDIKNALFATAKEGKNVFFVQAKVVIYAIHAQVQVWIEPFQPLELDTTRTIAVDVWEKATQNATCAMEQVSIDAIIAWGKVTRTVLIAAVQELQIVLNVMAKEKKESDATNAMELVKLKKINAALSWVIILTYTSI